MEPMKPDNYSIYIVMLQDSTHSRLYSDLIDFIFGVVIPYRMCRETNLQNWVSATKASQTTEIYHHLRDPGSVIHIALIIFTHYCPSIGQYNRVQHYGFSHVAM